MWQPGSTEHDSLVLISVLPSDHFILSYSSGKFVTAVHLTGVGLHTVRPSSQLVLLFASKKRGNLYGTRRCLT